MTARDRAPIFARVVRRNRRIAILGAGPGGTAACLELLDRGVSPSDLVIVDKARFPRPKLCGGGITTRGTAWLERVLGARPAGGCVTHGLEFRSTLGAFPVREHGPQWVYDRGELDHALLEACRARGVEVREETPVHAVEPGLGTEWRVRSGRNVVETFEWVIGADGANSLVRRASRLPGGIVGRLVEAVFEPVSADVDEDTLVFDFDPILDGIPGYAWIFPYPDPARRRGTFKIGVMDGRGVASGDALRRWTLDYAARHGYRLADSKVHGWPERYFDVGTRGHVPGLLLVGEALGIDALLGEGIAPSLFIGSYAAGRLRRALDEGTAHVDGYEAGFFSTPEGRNLWFQARLADRIYGDAPHRWLRVLFDMPHLRHLAGSGEEAYGRLARNIPTLLSRYGWSVLRHGLPSAAPIAPQTTPAAVAESRAVQ